ncbi:MAG: hypothetical protein D6699_00760 [Aquificota bacterium]|nr:MAG: hypothetical protein D6699_00760 [Aquificota bacterium]
MCESKEEKAQRQVVEGVFSWLKRFNYLSGWRRGITLLTYLLVYLEKRRFWHVPNFSPSVVINLSPFKYSW